MIRFDAYTATTTAAKPDDLGNIFFNAIGLDLSIKQGKGYHTFGERLSFRDHTGSEVGAISHGGKQGERVMLEVKGEITPIVVSSLRDAYPHRVTRVDACADFDAPGVFDKLLRPCQKVKRAHNIIGSKAGDWDDYPELGRTFYIGSASSVAKARLYEKGKQPEYLHLNKPDWCRLEIQVRPAKEAKDTYAVLSPVEVWGASKWSRELAAQVLQEHIDPHPAGTTYRLSDRERATNWMCKQYGVHLVSLAADLGGWDVLGLTLGEIIKQQSKGLQ